MRCDVFVCVCVSNDGHSQERQRRRQLGGLVTCKVSTAMPPLWQTPVTRARYMLSSLKLNKVTPFPECVCVLSASVCTSIYVASMYERRPFSMLVLGISTMCTYNIECLRWYTTVHVECLCVCVFVRLALVGIYNVSINARHLVASLYFASVTVTYINSFQKLAFAFPGELCKSQNRPRRRQRAAAVVFMFARAWAPSTIQHLEIKTEAQVSFEFMWKRGKTNTSSPPSFLHDWCSDRRILALTRWRRKREVNTGHTSNPIS